MVYETKTRYLHTGVRDIVKLNPTENKLLICLSSCNCRSYQELEEYIQKTNISRIVNNLRRKSGLRIITRKNFGTRLEDEIYFE
jgi:hypothetical protein